MPNQSPVGAGQLDTGPRCNSTFPCDNYTLTVSLPSGYTAAHPNAAVKVSAGWTDTTGTGEADYDLYIYKGVVATTDGSMQADYQSASASNPEVAAISPLADGTHQYSIKLVPYTPTGETLHVTMELLPGSGTAGGGGTGGVPFGTLDTTAPGKPRFQTFTAPTGSTAESSSGEFNIGYNPAQGRIMVMNSGPIWRLTPPERLALAKPECCDALWEDKSSTVTNTGLDPILFTDQKSGRTFASNFTAGANALYAYTDNDGDSYTPLGAAAPSGGADHETIGTGPYPASLSNLSIPLVNKGEAVYYCSQDIVGPATCSRSDTLGASYGPGVLAYTGNGLTQPNPLVPGGPCGGLHGHVHVAPDGTVWLPVNHCGGLQGGVFSTDGGTTWVNFTVPNAISQTQGADPSIAIDADSRVYYAYVNNEPVPNGNPAEGHARAATGIRTGNTVAWSNYFDLGATHGIVNAAEIEAVGGSSGRAGIGFLGTNVPGATYQNIDFPGKWYAFIAETYNQGQTWTTVNSTPNDPVQSMTGVWQQGGGELDRNLLDFNEITVDDRGRVLYGYSDGCVTEGCIMGTAPNDYKAFMRVARQTGGESLFASNDASTDTTTAIAPKPPCLSGTRNSTMAELTWKAPDNGGSDIVKYLIFRGTSPGNEVQIGATTTPITKYTDTTVLPGITHYYYTVKAVNASSTPTGNASNEIDLPITLPPPVGSLCVLPGLTELTDAAADSLLSPASAGTDLLSLQVAQPYQPDGVPRIVFTLNTDPGVSPQPTGSFWYVAMKIVNGAQTTYKGVHMVFTAASPATPTFESYTVAANTSGTADGRFVTAGTTVPAEATSSYKSPYTQIVMVVKVSDLGLAPGDTISGFVAGSGQGSDLTNTGTGVAELYDMMPDSLSYTSIYSVVDNNATCSPLQSVVSRKIHGSAGTFDIPLPLVGNAGIESRSGATPGAYTLVYTLDRAITVPGTATVTPSGNGNVVLGPNANQVTVNLTNIPNAQHVVVTLNGLQDAAATVLGNLAARMDVLIGDVNQSDLVDGNDVSAVQSKSRQKPTSMTFRDDVNANGLIDGNDVSATQAKTRTALH